MVLLSQTTFLPYIFKVTKLLSCNLVAKWEKYMLFFEDIMSIISLLRSYWIVFWLN